MKQVLLTVAAGKRLIGKALSCHPEIEKALDKGTIVIIAGTTNSYVVQEIFKLTGETRPFERTHFFRGITLSPDYKVSESGRLPDKSGIQGDVVIQNGVWLPGKTINDVAEGLKEGDIVLKGANALDLTHRRAAVLIGNPNGGTTIPILQALIGRRIRLILPVGLEKRIPGDLDSLANKLNAPGVKGWRYMPIPGEVFTEIEALFWLTGVNAELFASGGVSGAEGCGWLVVTGSPSQEAAAEKILESLGSEPPFNLG